MILEKELIEHEIVRRSLDYKEVAELAGISEHTLQKARRGESVRPSVAGRIAKTLQIPVEDLIIFAGTNYPPGTP